MEKYIYLFCERNNISGSVTETAYSSKRKAMAEYETMRDKRPGLPVNFVSEESNSTDHLSLRGMIDHLEAHCFIGPRNGNQHYQSCYVVRKCLF